MQAARSLRNLDKVLIAAGLSRDNVASVHVYISDIADWDVVNAACAEFFGGARVIVLGNRDHCADVCREKVEKEGVYYANHVYNPYLRNIRAVRPHPGTYLCACGQWDPLYRCDERAGRTAE